MCKKKAMALAVLIEGTFHVEEGIGTPHPSGGMTKNK